MDKYVFEMLFVEEPEIRRVTFNARNKERALSFALCFALEVSDKMPTDEDIDTLYEDFLGEYDREDKLTVDMFLDALDYQEYQIVDFRNLDTGEVVIDSTINFVEQDWT